MKDFGIYNAQNEGVGTVSAETAEEALEIFKQEDPKAKHYGEGYWAEELDS